jgi:hypothetical protein
MGSIELGIRKQNREQCSKSGHAWTDSPFNVDEQASEWSAIMDGKYYWHMGTSDLSTFRFLKILKSNTFMVQKIMILNI